MSAGWRAMDLLFIALMAVTIGLGAWFTHIAVAPPHWWATGPGHFLAAIWLPPLALIYFQLRLGNRLPRLTRRWLREQLALTWLKPDEIIDPRFEHLQHRVHILLGSFLYPLMIWIVLDHMFSQPQGNQTLVLYILLLVGNTVWLYMNGSVIARIMGYNHIIAACKKPDRVGISLTGLVRVASPLVASTAYAILTTLMLIANINTTPRQGLGVCCLNFTIFFVALICKFGPSEYILEWLDHRKGRSHELYFFFKD